VTPCPLVIEPLQPPLSDLGLMQRRTHASVGRAARAGLRSPGQRIPHGTVNAASRSLRVRLFGLAVMTQR
jgi:hypothetical protein